VAREASIRADAIVLVNIVRVLILFETNFEKNFKNQSFKEP
jgi:hypothetical protein